MCPSVGSGNSTTSRAWKPSAVSRNWWLRAKKGAKAPTAESIRQFCIDHIAHYKIPRYVVIIDDYPMTVTGKTRKVELRERGAVIVTSGNHGM
jgi:acyl-CoA synthetase (AMP-forming)/AMP-acid ligase II